MAKIYGILGRTSNYDNAREWPVCYRLSFEDVKTCIDTLNAERDLFCEELKPIHEALDDLENNRLKSPRTYGTYRRQGRKLRFAEAQSRGKIEAQEATRRAKKAKLCEQEAAVNRKYAAEMLDPLFPTSTNGVAPDDVIYRVVEFPDDPREEMTLGDLLKLRAALHGSQDSDDETPDDEDF